ncbi:MAG: maleylpyruvate isomerase family mycothiol-dependent enzyme [Nocardioidaceae bacterium]|nr:maleylpyruvate isomerase family mycothiol-dependent enzyme [Nocardioidaceae bacterium]NUS49844.1 maleylpyruvate isomerase family mycothiol-dependent enzyme [Nocardioidaceae bacterium]
MTLSTFDYIAAITEHSAGFADATRDNLTARVEHCPDWSVADLVRHLTEVHWFWGTIVEELLDEPPEEGRRPAHAEEDGLVDAFVAGAQRLVQVLREADQSAHAWTWASWQQDVAFVTRHQVQEAAVHHWDAVNAAGGSLDIAPDVAADSIDEFLHFSVASEDDPDDPPETALDGTLAFRATDTDDAWTLVDGDRPGTARVLRGVGDDAPVLSGTASDLLLWLYQRKDLDAGAVPDDLVKRFRAICFTD